VSAADLSRVDILGLPASARWPKATWAEKKFALAHVLYSESKTPPDRLMTGVPPSRCWRRLLAGFCLSARNCPSPWSRQVRTGCCQSIRPSHRAASRPVADEVCQVDC